MSDSQEPSTQAGGSVTAGAFLGILTGLFTMWLPLYLLPYDDEAGWFSIGFTILALAGCVIAALDSPDERRTFIGFFWGVIAGAGSLVLMFIWALSQLGS